MAHTNVHEAISEEQVNIEALMLRIRERVRERQVGIGALRQAQDGASEQITSPEESTLAAKKNIDAQADVNSSLANALSMLVRNVHDQRVNLAVAEQWLREETEYHAQQELKVREQVDRLVTSVELLAIRVENLAQQIDGLAGSRHIGLRERKASIPT